MRLLSTLILLSVTILSCKDYYNEAIHWADEIHYGTDINKVKMTQPDFVQVDWEHPQTVNDTTKYYSIVEIQGSNDVLNMSHELVFNSNKYAGRRSRK